MATARDDLGLGALWVVHPGAASVALAPKVRCAYPNPAANALGNCGYSGGRSS